MPLSSFQSAVTDVSADPPSCRGLPHAAVTALWRGRIVDAVKLVRVEQNIGSKEAEDQVHAYLRTQPTLRSHILKAQVDAREGLLRWLIFLFVGAAGLAYLLT